MERAMVRKMAYWLVVVAASLMLTAPTALAANPYWGDLNDDANVDLADVILALKIVAGLPETASSVATGNLHWDVNKDGRIGIDEAVYALGVAANVRTKDQKMTSSGITLVSGLLGLILLRRLRRKSAADQAGPGAN